MWSFDADHSEKQQFSEITNLNTCRHQSAKDGAKRLVLALIKHPPSCGATQHRINTILKGSPGFVRGKHVEVEFEHVCRTCYFLPSVWLLLVDLICLMLRREGRSGWCCGGEEVNKGVILPRPRRHFFDTHFLNLSKGGAA